MNATTGSAMRRAIGAVMAMAAASESQGLAAQSLGGTIISRVSDAPRIQLWEVQSNDWPEAVYRVDQAAYVVVFAVTHPGRIAQIRVVAPRGPRDDFLVSANRSLRISNIGNWPRVRNAPTLEERQVLLVAFASTELPDMGEFIKGRDWNNEQSYEILTRDPQDMIDALAQVIFARTNAQYDYASLTITANPRNVISATSYGYPNYGSPYYGSISSGCAQHNEWLQRDYLHWLQTGGYRRDYDARWPDRSAFHEGWGGGFPFYAMALGYSVRSPSGWGLCLGFRTPTWAYRPQPTRPVVGGNSPATPVRHVPLPAGVNLPRLPVGDNATRIDPVDTPPAGIDMVPLQRTATPVRPGVPSDPVRQPRIDPVTIEPVRVPDPVVVTPLPMSQPVRIEPVRQPERIEPVRIEPIRQPPPQRVEPVRVEPVRVEPVRVEPVRVEPVRVEPVRVEPVRVPPRVEPVRQEPARVEPVRVEPVKSAPPPVPVKVEPPARVPPPEPVRVKPPTV